MDDLQGQPKGRFTYDVCTGEEGNLTMGREDEAILHFTHKS